MVSLWLSTGTAVPSEHLTKCALLAVFVGRQVVQMYLGLALVTDAKAGIFIRCLILTQRYLQRETEPRVRVIRDEQHELGTKFC